MTRKTKNTGFSLMELLVVIAIISLLVTIMFPSIAAFRKRAYKAKSIGAFQELSSAALQFKSDTEYYPGQKENISSSTTGSQILSACLLGGVTVNDSGNIVSENSDGEPTSNLNLSTVESNYIEYSTDRFKEINGKKLTPSDQWKSGEEMAIVYYPSILGNNGSAAEAFNLANDYAHNDDYGATFPTDSTILKDKLGLVTGKFGEDEVKNSDSFLLIAPSLDRKYFWNTTDDKCDDIKNY